MFEDIKIMYGGVECVLLSAKYINQYLPLIHDFVRGIMFVLLIFFNINQVSRLIRGISLGNSERGGVLK